MSDRVSPWELGEGTSIGRFPGKVAGPGQFVAEPSGLAVVGDVIYVVSDNGTIAWKNGDVWHWRVLQVPGHPKWTDFESLTTVPGRTDYLYVGVERGRYELDDKGAEKKDSKQAPIIVELKIVNLAAGSDGDPVMCEDRWWALTSTDVSGNGMEAMTFVQDGNHNFFERSSGGFGGLFYASTQGVHGGTDQQVDYYELPVGALGGTAVTKRGSFSLQTQKLAEMHCDGDSLWTLVDDELGDRDFESSDPSPEAYVKYHRDPANGDQRLEEWRPTTIGTYYRTHQTRPPKVGCEALGFLGNDLLIGYDQSDRQAYRNDSSCPRQDVVLPPTDPRMQLRPDSIWSEAYFLKAVEGKPGHSVRSPTAYYNHVRRYSQLFDRKKWESKTLPAEAQTIPWTVKVGKNDVDKTLTIFQPAAPVPDGFFWLGQQVVVGAQFPAPVPPMIAIFRWIGPGRNPLVETSFGQYLWNDRGSGGSMCVRVWSLNPIPREKEAASNYQPLGVFFETAPSGSNDDPFYGRSPDNAKLKGLAALHVDFLAEVSNVADRPQLWSSEGLHHKFKATSPAAPAWRELHLWQWAKSPSRIFPLTVAASSSASPPRLFKPTWGPDE